MAEETYANWDDVSESGVLPEMRANVTIRDWKKDFSQAGRLQFAVGFMVDEPAQFRGRYVRKTYTVGGREEADLDKFDPASIDAGHLKSMLSACQISVKGVIPVEQLLRTAEGTKLTIHLTEPTQKDKDAGFDWRNNITNYYPLGQYEPEMMGKRAADAARPSAPPMPPEGMLPGRPGMGN